MSLETPECEAHGGSSNARGKRPPAVEINSFSTHQDNPDFLHSNLGIISNNHWKELLGRSTSGRVHIEKNNGDVNATYLVRFPAGSL